MSGKKKKPGAANKGWGGKRPGTGPKKTTVEVSDDVKARYITAAEKLADEKGETVEYAALSMIWDPEVAGTVKASILKTYNEALLVKSTEQNIEVTDERQGPVIGLPPSKQDPAKLIPIEGGRKKDE